MLLSFCFKIFGMWSVVPDKWGFLVIISIRVAFRKFDERRPMRILSSGILCSSLLITGIGQRGRGSTKVSSTAH